MTTNKPQERLLELTNVRAYESLSPTEEQEFQSLKQQIEQALGRAEAYTRLLDTIKHKITWECEKLGLPEAADPIQFLVERVEILKQSEKNSKIVDKIRKFYFDQCTITYPDPTSQFIHSQFLQRLQQLIGDEE